MLDRMVLFDIRSNGTIRYSIEWYYSIFDRMVPFDIRSNGTIRCVSCFYSEKFLLIFVSIRGFACKQSFAVRDPHSLFLMQLKEQKANPCGTLDLLQTRFRTVAPIKFKSRFKTFFI